MSVPFSHLWYRLSTTAREENRLQPRPQGLLLVQNGGRRNPWPRLPKWLQKFVRISSRKHDEMSSFCLNKGFRLQKTGPPDAGNNLRKGHFIMCHVTKYSTILDDSWSISALFSSLLGQGFLRPPF